MYISKPKVGEQNWILINSTGEDTILDNVDKHEILHKFQIHARDLRILDPLYSQPCAILVREKAILVSLEVL